MAKKTNFTLACHWAFPKDQGGIGMHNIYLLQILQKYFHVSIVSLSNKVNNEYYLNLNREQLFIDQLNFVCSKNQKLSLLKSDLVI